MNVEKMPSSLLPGDRPESCEQCSHEFDPHAVFALGETVASGGVILCNVPGCRCVSTWALPGRPVPPMPDPEAIDRLREYAQGERHWSEP